MQPIPLICLPYAGAGASFFRQWKSPAGMFEIMPIQLPGREQLFVEEPYRDVSQAIDGIVDEVRERIGSRPSVAIFGHSMGAVLAYELARRFHQTTSIDVSLLAVSGSPGPWGQRRHRATGLDDDAFISQVIEFAGYRHPALEDPAMRELLLPMLRADIEMHENYVPSSDAPMTVPVVAVRGIDDELVSTSELDQWHRVTTSTFDKIELPGGHMYLAEEPAALLRAIDTALDKAIKEKDCAACR